MDVIERRFSTHPNGGARIYDSAFIHPSVYAGPDVIIKDHARVLSGHLEGHVTVQDWARIFGGRISGTEKLPSLIGIETVIANHPRIISSTVCNRDVSGSCLIRRCGLFDQSSVSDNAGLSGVVMRNGSMAYGNATLDGQIMLTGDMRVGEGRWTRAPQYVDLEFCQLTEGIDGKVGIDCRFEPVEFWLNLTDEFAKVKKGWSGQQCQAVRDAIRTVIEL